jgi:PiT family inorganic phosphate transporter
LNFTSRWSIKENAVIVSASFSLGHGGNDSQKSNGYYSGSCGINANPGIQMDAWLMWLPSESGAFKMPMDSLACYSAIAAGTLSGWKIVKQWVSKSNFIL